MDRKWKNVVLMAVAVAAVLLVFASRNRQKQAEGYESLYTDVQPGEGDKPMLMELGAHWCQPCKMMMPVLAELSADYGDKLHIRFVNVDDDAEYARSFGISAIPVQIFFNAEGTEVFRHVGFYSKQQIVEKWRELGVEL